MKSRLIVAVVSLSLIPLSATGLAQAVPLVALDRPSAATDFLIAANGQATAIYVAPGNPETVRVAAEAFAADVERVTGVGRRCMSEHGKIVVNAAQRCAIRRLHRAAVQCFHQRGALRAQRQR